MSHLHLLARRGGLLAWLLLAACGPDASPSKPPPSQPPAVRDLDSDGVPAAQDCADDDASRYQRLAGFADGDGDGVGDGAEQQVCAGAALPTGWAARGGDCAPQHPGQWRLLTLYADADGDLATLGAAQAQCVGAAVPRGFRTEAGTEDCNDSDARVHRAVELYADADGDGVGAGDLQSLCLGVMVPPGLTPTGGDCAPEDVQRHTLLPYAFRDADGDGATVAEAGEVCAGFALPQGYRNSASGADCNDADAAVFLLQPGYVDADGDGVGVGAAEQVCGGAALPAGYGRTGEDCAPADAQLWAVQPFRYRDADGDGRVVMLTESAQLCAGAAAPAGYARSAPPGVGFDCDDAEAGLWQLLAYAHRDADGDGRTVPRSGALCAGATLPAGYATQASGADCNDADAQLHTQLSGYPDADADGFGAGEAQAFCTGGSLPAGFLATATDCAADDATRWRTVTPGFRDSDRDGHTVPEPVPTAQCIGAAPPHPGVLTASGNDCQDDDAQLFHWRVLYPDRDGDGVGASPRQVRCLGRGALPAGLSPYGWDSDDTDRERQEAPEDRFAAELLLGL